MDIELADNVRRAKFPLLSWLLSRQAFWVFIAVCVACVYLSFATNTFATSNNLYNITRNFTFTAIIALGMTMVIITGGIDLSVGSVLVPVQHDPRGRHACRLQHRGRHRRFARHRLAVGAFNGC